MISEVFQCNSENRKMAKNVDGTILSIDVD